MPIRVDASQASGPLAFFGSFSLDRPRALRPTEGVASLVGEEEQKATASQLSLATLSLQQSQRSQDTLARSPNDRLPVTTASARSALRNVNRGVTILQTADEALADIEATLTTMQSLATQSADPYMTNDRRVALASQFAEELAKIDPIMEQSAVDGFALIGPSEPTPPIPATGAVVTAPVAQTAKLASNETLTFDDYGLFAGLSPAQRQITLTNNMTQPQVVSAINANPSIGSRVQASVNAQGFLTLTSVATGSGATFRVKSDRVASFQRTGIGTSWLTGTGTDEIPGEPGQSDLELQVDIGANPALGDDRLRLHLDPASAEDLGVSGLTIGTEASAATAVAALDTALTAVKENRIKASVQLDALSRTATSLTTRRAEQTSLESVLTAREAAESAVALARSDAATLLVSQANARPEAALKLLA